MLTPYSNMNQNLEQFTDDFIASKLIWIAWCILHAIPIKLIGYLFIELRSCKKEFSFAYFKYAVKSFQNFILNPSL